MLIEQILAVLNALPDPAFFWKDGKIANCNRACQRLPLHPGDAPAFLTEVTLPDTGEMLHWETEIAGCDWEVTAQTVEDGHLLFLRRSETAGDTMPLLAAAARSMQGPLSSILSAGGKLFPELEEMEDESVQAQTAAITRGCFQLVRAANAITEYSRLSGEEPTLSLAPTDVTDFFYRLAEKATDALLDRGMELRYTGPKTVVYGNIDQTLVQKAVLNLISNAAKYALEGTAIELTVQPAGSLLKIQVKNQGETMDADILSTAFSRFRQDPGAGDDRWGTGLGLPLVQVIARRHGGSVLLESGEKGTTVTMTLRLNLPKETVVMEPRVDVSGGYDQTLVELSGVLPDKTFDSRNVDI